MKRRTPRWLKKGALVDVDWVDTTSSGAGDSANTFVSVRQTVGRMIEIKDSEFVCETKKKVVAVAKRPTLVITDTKDADGSHQEGWTAIPLANVLRITLLRYTKEAWRPAP